MSTFWRFFKEHFLNSCALRSCTELPCCSNLSAVAGVMLPSAVYSGVSECFWGTCCVDLWSPRVLLQCHISHWEFSWRLWYCPVVPYCYKPPPPVCCLPGSVAGIKAPGVIHWDTSLNVTVVHVVTHYHQRLHLLSFLVEFFWFTQSFCPWEGELAALTASPTMRI